MFPDAFLPNLVIFLVAQVAAWGYLRTGLIRRGVFLMVSTWILADAALLARFAYEEVGASYRIPLSLMQLHALLEAFLLASGQLRRRFTKTARQRPGLFQRAFVHYLRDELDEAAAIFTRLRRNDPWDLQSTLALANVMACGRRKRRAIALYRQARGLDRHQQYRDFIGHQLKRFAARRRG